ncbi:hypothetical protein KAS79_04130 [Candidatus Parcubacteria bacterium]|nr:hypothetical protein [Candidatus Parcubacteria bacterium]
MTLKEILKNKIEASSQITRDALRNYARNIKTQKQPFGWDIATTDRKLRNLTEDGVIKPIIKKGYIVAYKHIKAELDDKNQEKIGLDEQLKAILSNIKVSWENADKIAKLKNAIASKNDYSKQSLIIQLSK